MPLLLFASVLLCGCIGGVDSLTTTTQPYCGRPYIRVGVGCCLDRNGNGVCDSDEVRETTVPAPPPLPDDMPATTQSTVTTQTMIIPSPPPLPEPTTTIQAACYSDSDCGGKVYTCGKYYCKDGDVYRECKVMGCYNPGQPDSFCSKADREILQDECSQWERCEDGKRECQS